jgi:hypothetical protein
VGSTPTDADAAWAGGRPAAPAWNQAEADALLAVAEGHAHGHAMEAARGWDALALLRGVRPLFREIVARAKGAGATT